MAADTDNYDIVIAGGGMIGSSLALALAPLGLRIAVVEAVEKSAAQQPSFDDRSTALSRSTQRTFEAIGLWPEIVAAATAIDKIHVSDKGRFGFSHIDADEQGVEALGYVVINRALGEVLHSHLQASPAITMLCPKRIIDLELGPDSAKARMSDGRSLQCKLLVAADGANSSVREMMGIAARQQEYEQAAIVGNLQTELPLAGRAFERFTSQGPLAILPLIDERAGFIWTVSSANADRIAALDDDDFLRQLQAEFGYRLGELTRVGKRSVYPLALTKAVRLTATRSVLVGNAAHGLHPVSAQGFNLGVRDVAALADCIADCMGAQLASDADIGSQALLRRYADWRRHDQQKLVRFTDGLVRLFVSERPPLKILRNIGMMAFDLVPGVRSQFARHTMGLAGRLPRLSRGLPIR